MDGETSTNLKVLSEVPQGMVLGPLKFLLYINNINTRITSSIHLFTDDGLLLEWIKQWQMILNPAKCVT